jgi:hypothetical protein
MAFKKLSLPVIALKYAFGPNDACFPLAHEDKQLYAAEIAIGNWTWVTVSNDTQTEAIKLGTMDYMGCIPVLARSATPQQFYDGACVGFGWTDEAIAELYPETGLDFVDGCGKVSKCACDYVPGALAVGQMYDIIVPYIGAPTSRSVTLNIPGMGYSTSNAAASINGTPTTKGTYAVSIKLTKGALSRTMFCQVKVVDPADLDNMTACN